MGDGHKNVVKKKASKTGNNSEYASSTVIVRRRKQIKTLMLREVFKRTWTHEGEFLFFILYLGVVVRKSTSGNPPTFEKLSEWNNRDKLSKHASARLQVAFVALVAVVIVTYR